jgi:hypothetical protein
VAKPREDQSHPSEEDRWQKIQGSRELGGSRNRSPKVGCSNSRAAKTREDQSHPSEEDRWQKIQGSRELGGLQGRIPKVGCSKSRVPKPREDQSRPFEEDRWQRSRDLMSSEVHRVRVQAFGAPSCETRGARKKGSHWFWVVGEPSDLHVGSCIGVS